MLNKKKSDNATRASIKKEMAKPRMAKSARTVEMAYRSDKGHRPGTVGKIIAILHRNQPETQDC